MLEWIVPWLRRHVDFDTTHWIFQYRTIIRLYNIHDMSRHTSIIIGRQMWSAVIPHNNNNNIRQDQREKRQI